MRFVFFGLSIASAWGSGHATTYRCLLRELAARGHDCVFYEKCAHWFDDNCDLPRADYCDIRRYKAWQPETVQETVAEADVVVLGSYTADGIAIADWLPGRTRALLAYYDIDTPVTLERFEAAGTTEYLRADQLSRFDLVLSFAGGPALGELCRFGARRAHPLYCAVDASLHRPVPPDPQYVCDLGYMGTYAAARQDLVEELFLAPARLRPEYRFILAGAQYPAEIRWPPNVYRADHVAPADHPAFYTGCAWQVKVLRSQMRRAGWAPSVTHFEAGACGAALISDDWPGFEHFFAPGTEALVAGSRDDILAALELPDAHRRRIGEAARRRVLASHTYVQRVDELEHLLTELGVSTRDRATDPPVAAGAAGPANAMEAA